MNESKRAAMGVGCRKEAATILEWYDEHQRSLPWRSSADPYQILVSEVMLQQTQVRRVIPYFERFLALFPNVAALAAAHADDVEAAWSGLGYYRRARFLHQAAKVIADRGKFPRTSQDLIDLPGIGPYTAAAVASIAFGECVPVLDGNVERVLSRRLAFGGEPKTRQGRTILEGAARGLLDPARPGDSNQALMEIGATICKPRRPRCGECPLATDCRGRLSPQVENFPKRSVKRRTEEVEINLVVVISKGRLLLFRRSRTESFLAGQWEIPNCEGSEPDAEALASLYGGSWRISGKLGAISHTITYRSIRASVYSGEYRISSAEVRGGAFARRARWVEPASLKELPLSSLVSKVLSRFDPWTVPEPD